MSWVEGKYLLYQDQILKFSSTDQVQSVVLNPNRPNYARLKAGIESLFVDDYFPLDSIVMDQNSQDFESRILKINTNAEAICALLQSYPSVKWVYYPKYSPTREFYDECRRPSGGYGYLLSIIFHQRRDAIQFIDAIDVPKGPSLGTNFTLASPYTLLAHFGELEWVSVILCASPGVSLPCLRIGGCCAD